MLGRVMSPVQWFQKFQSPTATWWDRFREFQRNCNRIQRNCTRTFWLTRVFRDVQWSYWKHSALVQWRIACLHCLLESFINLSSCGFTALVWINHIRSKRRLLDLRLIGKFTIPANTALGELPRIVIVLPIFHDVTRASSLARSKASA